jgi:hypothetical protein
MTNNILRRIQFIPASIMLLLAYFGADLFVLHDFSIYWCAATFFFNGVSPYSLPHQNEYLFGTFGLYEPYSVLLVAWIPPYSMVLLFPIAVLSLWIAKYLWICLMEWLLYRSLMYIAPILRTELSKDLLGFIFVLSFTSFFCLLLKVVVVSGSITWIPFIPCTLLVASHLRRKMHFRAGFYATLYLFKLQFVVLLLAAIIVSNALRGNFRFLFGLVFGFIFLATTSLVVNPSSWLAYNIAGILDYLQHYYKFINVLGGIFMRNGFDIKHTIVICLLASVLAGIAIGAFANRHNIKDSVLLLAVAPLSLMLAPYGWYHDLLALTPSYLFAVQLVVKRCQPLLTTTVAMLFGGQVLIRMVTNNYDLFCKTLVGAHVILTIVLLLSAPGRKSVQRQLIIP